MKIHNLAFLIFFLFLTFYGFSQNNVPLTKEEAAVQYLCGVLTKDSTKLNRYKMLFNNKTEGLPSSINHVAAYLSGMNFVQYSIENRNYLDSISKVLSKIKYDVIKVKHSCNCFRKMVFPFFRGRYTMHLYNSIDYKGFSYVEIHLKNKFYNEHSVFIIKFEKEGVVPIDHYFMNYHVDYF